MSKQLKTFLPMRGEEPSRQFIFHQSMEEEKRKAILSFFSGMTCDDSRGDSHVDWKQILWSARVACLVPIRGRLGEVFQTVPILGCED